MTMKINTLVINAGSGTITVPDYDGFMRVEIWGPGGGAAGYTWTIDNEWRREWGTVYNGAAGTATSVSTLAMIANGGGGSSRADKLNKYPTKFGGTLDSLVSQGAVGVGGTASGGDVNLTGADGIPTTWTTLPAEPPVVHGLIGHWDKGSLSALRYAIMRMNPGANGTKFGMGISPVDGFSFLPAVQTRTALPARPPGGGGNGTGHLDSTWGGIGMGGGGDGGYAKKEWANPGVGPTPGASWSYAVGTPGAAGSNTVGLKGSAGAPGRVRLTWETLLSSDSESDIENPSSDEPEMSDSWVGDEFDSDWVEPGTSSEAPSDEDPRIEYLRTFPVPQSIDAHSIVSRGDRTQNGLITSGHSGFTLISNMADGFDNNYGFASGNGPYFIGGGAGSYLWFQFADVAGPNAGTWLRQIRFLHGDTASLGAWSVWAGFGHNDPTPMFKIGEFILQSVDDGTDTVCDVPTIALPGYDLPWPYYELRLDTSWSGGRISGEIEFAIAHSSLDGGDRRTGSKKIFVTSSMTPSAGALSDLINGLHRSDNRGGTLGLDFAFPTTSTVGAHLTFHFPRAVAMREMIMEVNSQEVYSGGNPTKWGRWQWKGSDDGTTFTDVGSPWTFPAGSYYMRAPSPQSADSSGLDELISYRYWRMVLVNGPAFSTSTRIWEITFNLHDPAFGEFDASDSDSGASSDEIEPGMSDFDSGDSVPPFDGSAESLDSDSFAGGDFAFDPATRENVTLSNGNLTATNVVALEYNSGAAVVATQQRSEGDLYFEMKMNHNDIAQTFFGFGMFNYFGNYAQFGNNGLHGVMVRPNGDVYVEGVNSGFNILAIANNETVGFAVRFNGGDSSDTDARIWIRNTTDSLWNNTVGHDPALGTGGIPFSPGYYRPAVAFGGGGVNAQVTLNLGATAFQDTPPTGFVGWDGTFESYVPPPEPSDSVFSDSSGASEPDVDSSGEDPTNPNNIPFIQATVVSINA